MSEKHYKWNFNSPTVIEQHSLAKHEVLRAYLINYVRTLTLHRSQEELRLTLVDGFSGGGIYQHATKKELVYGSPIIMLDAINEANFIINQNREKQINLKVDYFFIDKNKSACNCLKEALKFKNYGNLIEKSIHIFQSTFQEQADNIISFISKKSRSKRSIFLLDQYGYSDVPVALIHRIINSLQGAEVILTFNVDAFANYVTDENYQTQKLLDKIGISNAFKGRKIEDIRNSEKDWRLFIQSAYTKS